MLVAIPHIRQGNTYGFRAGLLVNKRKLIVFDHQMIDPRKDKRIVNLFTRGYHHGNLNVIYLYRAESISSGERQSQHKPKQSLFGAIQESWIQIANLDSGQANVFRAS